jgi:integrase
MRLNLTDLAIRRLKWSGSQKKYWDTNLKGFGLRVSKFKKTFVVMVGIERKLITVGHFPDKALKDARSEAKAVLVQWSGSPLKSAQNAKTYFIEHCKLTTRPKTYIEYERYLELLDKDPPDLTLDEIRNTLNKLEGKPSSQNYAFATYRAYLNWCVREQIIRLNPLATIPLPHKLASRDRVLSDDELKEIWKHTNNQPYGYIVRLLMLTGQRKSEIANLTDISDGMTFPQTKGNPHTVPITPLVQQHLPVQTFNGWSKSKVRLDKNSGVTNWKLHDLRRTFSTNCAKLGVPIHITEHILNHRSGSVSGIVKVYNRYSYLKEMEDALLLHEEHIKKLVTI